MEQSFEFICEKLRDPKREDIGLMKAYKPAYFQYNEDQKILINHLKGDDREKLLILLQEIRQFVPTSGEVLKLLLKNINDPTIREKVREVFDQILERTRKIDLLRLKSQNPEPEEEIGNGEERLEQEKLENERKEQERLENEKKEQEKLENEKKEQEKLENEKREQERLENERKEQEKLKNEKKEQENQITEQENVKNESKNTVEEKTEKVETNEEKTEDNGK
jgi:hypothetical protein